ncbi:MAG: LysR family transcriptional regulator [Kiloniellaceae bacterium]
MYERRNLIELRELQYFVAVAERLNVSSAAKAVHLSQPALSRQIQSLERKLSVALFERGGKRLILTAEGEDLLVHASGLLDQAQAFLNRAYGLEHGHVGLLRVAASPQTIAWLLSPAMAQFSKAHPNVSLIVSEGHNEALLEQVEHGSAHLAIASLGASSKLVARKLFTARLFAILPPGHSHPESTALSFENIAEETFLLLRRGFLTRQLFDQACAAHNIRPMILLESDSTHTLISLAMDGHGVAVVSSSAGNTREMDRAVPLVSSLCETQADVSAVWNPNRYRPASLPAFLALLEKMANPPLHEIQARRAGTEAGRLHDSL